MNIFFQEVVITGGFKQFFPAQETMPVFLLQIPLTISTMRIDRIEASKHKRGRVLVFLADGSLLKVTEQELLTFGLRSGDELDEEILMRLKEAAGVSNIKTTAADLVGRRAMSRRELEKKLQEKGASETEARYAGEWLGSYRRAG